MPVRKIFGRLGKDVRSDLLFPDPLNEDESILDLEKRKLDRKRQYEQNNDVGLRFYFDIMMDTYKEQKLWEKYGDRYENDPFYREQLPRIRESYKQQQENMHEPDSSLPDPKK